MMDLLWVVAYLTASIWRQDSSTFEAATQQSKEFLSHSRTTCATLESPCTSISGRYVNPDTKSNHHLITHPDSKIVYHSALLVVARADTLTSYRPQQLKQMRKIGPCRHTLRFLTCSVVTLCNSDLYSMWSIRVKVLHHTDHTHTWVNGPLRSIGVGGYCIKKDCQLIWVGLQCSTSRKKLPKRRHSVDVTCLCHQFWEKQLLKFAS